ncbi:hypothetical protein ECTPHS_09784 [Ectothiorhodospira sp. PHS-1]|nr:hypothetical protein ECTPHS_09784 [Ectothiorhodospira sp. PHS-1]
MTGYSLHPGLPAVVTIITVQWHGTLKPTTTRWTMGVTLRLHATKIKVRTQVQQRGNRFELKADIELAQIVQGNKKQHPSVNL